MGNPMFAVQLVGSLVERRVLEVGKKGFVLRPGERAVLPDNIHPEQSIYYNGAFVLQVLCKHRVMNILDLYLNTRTYREMTMPVFVLCLDWLYLLNLVSLNDQGSVELCS
jgi:hypothetical protein